MLVSMVKHAHLGDVVRCEAELHAQCAWCIEIQYSDVVAVALSHLTREDMEHIASQIEAALMPPGVLGVGG